jgi:hypothetical protein
MNQTSLPPVPLWENFFTRFNQYAAERWLPQAPAVGGREAERFFGQFKEQYGPFVEAGGKINVWDAAGIGRDEVRNCAVLGWFLNCRESHGQGTAFMRCLLESAGTFPGGDAKPADFSQPGDPVYHIFTEQPYTHEYLDDSRVDIVLENEAFLLFIEAKIDAGETGDQLKRYTEILPARAGKRKHGMIFLTPDGRPGSVKGIIPLSWKRLAACFEEYADNRAALAAPQAPLWAAITRQFCRHIRQF